MSQNDTQIELDGRKRQVAELLALNELSDEEIARRVGVTRRTVARWKHLPSVQSAISETVQAVAEAIRLEGITNKQNRLQAYRDRHAQFEQIRRERAAAAEQSDSNLYGVPGATTGWIVAQLKLVKHIKDDDETGQKVWMEESWEYAVDTGLSREMLALEKQVGQETGQFTERLEVDQTGVIEFVGIDPEKL